MKTETCKLYSSVFRIFLPNFIKIDLHNFELYGFKVGAFFGTQCSLYFSLHTVNRGTGLQQRVFFHQTPQSKDIRSAVVRSCACKIQLKIFTVYSHILQYYF